jgi:outer membrane protein TolC
MLPTTVQEIEGGIQEARAMMRGGEAVLRQGTRDRAASFVATLVSLRNAERQAAVFESSIVPAAERIVRISRRSYAAGAAEYTDMIGAQRSLLDSRLMLAEARAMRETRLAELEALLGTDAETLGHPSPTDTHAPRVASAPATAQQETGP